MKLIERKNGKLTSKYSIAPEFIPKKIINKKFGNFASRDAILESVREHSRAITGALALMRPHVKNTDIYVDALSVNIICIQNILGSLTSLMNAFYAVKRHGGSFGASVYPIRKLEKYHHEFGDFHAATNFTKFVVNDLLRTKRVADGDLSEIDAMVNLIVPMVKNLAKMALDAVNDFEQRAAEYHAKRSYHRTIAKKVVQRIRIVKDRVAKLK